LAVAMTYPALTFERFAIRAGYDPADTVITFVNRRVELK
jgi:hypothetical protein